MKFVFITRVTRLKNIEGIKENLRKVFENSDVQYQHILMPDMTVLNDRKRIQRFADQKTRIFYVEAKRPDDKYAAYNIDQCIQTIPANEDCWIYLLDDDNRIAENFAQLAEDIDQEHKVLVFNIKMQKLNNGFDGKINAPLIFQKALFHVDSANYLIHRSVFQTCHHGNTIKSDWHDRILMEKILYCQIPIKYINKTLGFHNGF